MAIIAPSLLSANFLNLKDEIQHFDGIKDLWLHLDIMDGHFVPNLTFGVPVLKGLKDITQHPLDAHLMVSNPQDYIGPLSQVNIHNFTFHWEAVCHHDRLIQLAKETFSSVGVALNPSTDIRIIPDYILKNIDLVLIMSVNPGFGGQSFIQGCVEKIQYLNNFKAAHHLDFHIQVDGGVNDRRAEQLILAGATNLVAGSYIFNGKEQDYSKRVESLRAS